MTTDELRAKFEEELCEEIIVSCDEMIRRVGNGYEDINLNLAWSMYQAAHASRDAEVEELQTKVKWMRQYEKGLNRRAEVEEILFEVARGKHAPLSADECRQLAIKLGCTPK